MPAPIVTDPERFRVAPFRIFGNLYYVGNTSVCMHLIDTGAGLVLLDTGYPQTVGMLAASIEGLGFALRDVRVILNTHGHYDHIGGTRAMAALTGAATYLGREDVPLVTTRPELTEAELVGMTFQELYQPDHALEDGEVIRLGDTAIHCLHTPGHTPGAMSFLFEVSDGIRTALAGIHGGPGQATLKDEYLRRYHLPCSLRQAYADALTRLRAEPVDLHLATHPGQNHTFQRRACLAADPLAFIDAESWPRYLDALAAEYRVKL